MKKRVFIVIFLLLLVLTGGFLLLDKFYFHFVFKVTPGSCLILEEKYCKTGKLMYDENGGISGILFKVGSGIKLISPETSNILGKSISDNTVLVIIGKNAFDSEDTNKSLSYKITFSGKLKADLDQNQKINKGDVFGLIDIKNNNDGWVFLTIEDGSFKDNQLIKEINQEKIKTFIKK